MPGGRAAGQGCAIHLALPACLGESKTSSMFLAQELTKSETLKLDGVPQVLVFHISSMVAQKLHFLVLLCKIVLLIP